MSTTERIRLCRMIEKIEKNKEYAASLEVENTSGFHGKKMNEEREKKECLQ